MDEIRWARDYVLNLVIMQADRAMYLALAECDRRHAEVGPGPGAPGHTVALAPFELRVFSQNGEDGVIAEILRRVGAPQRFFVEFGVETGREGNSVFLADVAGWRGLFMEADDACYRQLHRRYIANSRVATVQAMVTPENVEELFESAEVPSEPDVVSIDIDGQDYWIWGALERYRPRVVVIEYNSAIDVRRRLVQPKGLRGGWDRTAYYGASLASLTQLAERKGYRLVHTELAGVNAFFVREDLAEGAFPAADEVVIRGAPNFYGRGHRHRPPRPGRQFLDLDTGQLVDAER